MEKQELEKIRHSCEHVLTMAMVKLYPGLKAAMGPATGEGFYFDFDYTGKISEADFPKIEEEMQRIINADLPIVHSEMSVVEAKEAFANNPYKIEWVEEADKRGEKVSIYTIQGESEADSFVDVCKGPHVNSTGKVGPFKLLSVAGAYWHGSEKNKMLTRIYGTAFPTQEELDQYLHLLEEAKKRDHKKLGQQMELFMFHETAPGMPYWLPKGVTLYNELVSFWREEHKKRGYQEIVSPLLNKKELYVTSGHYDHYWTEMFTSIPEKGQEYGLKAMNCPNSMNIFQFKTRSYKDLPLRLSDTDVLHRYELSGTLNGLFRVREFKQDDAHIFVSEDQIEDEYERIFEIVQLFYSIFGMDYRFRLSTRPDDFMGDMATWDKAQNILKEILEKSGKEYFVGEGEGAFYGPKADILMKDALGREWQMGTIQLDFQMPKRFKLEYIDQEGKPQTPITIHRVVYGSLERFIGILIEHYAGAFPVWLAPTQVQIIPITDRHNEYAQKVLEQLMNADVRAFVDDRSEKMQAKIRDAQLAKVPYMLIVGDKEVVDQTVAVRARDGQDLGAIKLAEFIAKVAAEIKERI